MPVCLNCGKQIPEGIKYCEGCGPALEKRTQLLLDMSERTSYKSPARGYNRTLIISMLVLAVLLITISVGIVLSIPSGTAYTRKVQAVVCRANIRRIDRAVKRYYAANGKYPLPGRIDRFHPIITDHYLDDPPRCPSTHHYYKLEYDGSKVIVKCDSNLPGHKL